MCANDDVARPPPFVPTAPQLATMPCRPHDGGHGGGGGGWRGGGGGGRGRGGHHGGGGRGGGRGGRGGGHGGGHGGGGGAHGGAGHAEGDVSAFLTAGMLSNPWHAVEQRLGLPAECKPIPPPAGTALRR